MSFKVLPISHSCSFKLFKTHALFERSMVKPKQKLFFADYSTLLVKNTQNDVNSGLGER